MHLANGGRRFLKYSFKSGLKKQQLCLGLFTLHYLAGVIFTLMTCWELAMICSIRS